MLYRRYWHYQDHDGLFSFFLLNYLGRYKSTFFSATKPTSIIWAAVCLHLCDMQMSSVQGIIQIISALTQGLKREQIMKCNISKMHIEAPRLQS